MDFQMRGISGEGETKDGVLAELSLGSPRKKTRKKTRKSLTREQPSEK